MNRPIRVVIADDHSLFRQGLRSLFEALSRRRRDRRKAERAGRHSHVIADHPCDCLLLDLQMDRSVLEDIGSLAQADARNRAHRRASGSRTRWRLCASARAPSSEAVRRRHAVEAIRRSRRTGLDAPVLQTVSRRAIRRAPDKQLTLVSAKFVRYVSLGLRNGESPSVYESPKAP